MSAKLRLEKIKNFVPYMGFVILLIFFEIVTQGKLLSTKNFALLINEGFTIVVACSALAFLLAQGDIDLSTGKIMAIAAIAGAFAAKISPVLAIPACIITGILIGSLNGLIAVRLRLPSFLATLIMSFFLGGLVQTILYSGGIGIPGEMMDWYSTNLWVITLVIVVVVCWFLFERTKLGKFSKAIGASPVVARMSGVKVSTMKITAFVITGGVAGLMAVYSLIYTGSATSATGVNYEFNALIALLLGGMPINGGPSAKFRSAIIGSLSMAILANGMSLWGVDTYYQQLIRGVIFLIVIMISFERKNVKVIK